MKYLFVLLFLAALSSCSDHGCEITQDEYYEGANYGHSDFHDSTTSWLPNPLPDKMIFKSSRGYVATFKLAKVDTSAPRVTIHTTTKDRQCGRDFTQDYITKDQLYIEYEPEKGLFDLWYKKEKVVNYTYNEAELPTLDSFPDKLTLVVANSGFIFSKDSSSVFYKTIVLDGVTFTDVYRFAPTHRRDPQYVSELYYSQTRGVVAFRFNDNEEWVRQD